MTNTIVLDLDGPLLDGIDRHYACYRSILDELGFPPIAKERYWSQKRERSDRRTLLRQSDAEQIYDEFLARWLARIESPKMLALDRLQPAVLEILGQWRTADVQLILATMRNHRENTLCQLEQLGLLPLLDHVCITGTCDHGGKAAAVRELLAREQAIWIGDTEVDIEAARQLQIPIYAVTCGLRTETKLREFGAEQVFTDLRDVSQSLDLIGDVSRRVA